MKKIIAFLIFPVLFAACNSNNKSDLDSNKTVLTDTSKMYNSNTLTDTGSVIHTSALPKDNTNTKAVANNNNTAPVHKSTNNNTTTTTTTTSNKRSTAAAPVRKKGWSHAAKDATIGGVGGAVAGAIISKKHGKGAIIGGVLGAGGGYILGRGKDKKEGR